MAREVDLHVSNGPLAGHTLSHRSVKLRYVPLSQFGMPVPYGDAFGHVSAHWEVMLHRVLGLALPAGTAAAHCVPPYTCDCGEAFDDFGDHADACKGGPRASTSPWIAAHNALMDVGIQLANLSNIRATAYPPPHGTPGRACKADAIVYLPDPVAGFDNFVTDTAVTCAGVEAKEKAKIHKHSVAYAARGHAFVPLVASTRGVLGDHFVRYLWVISDVATRACAPDLADVQLQRSRLLRRRLAAVSAAALGVGTARLLRRRVSSLPPRVRSRFVNEWDDGRGLAPA